MALVGAAFCGSAAALAHTSPVVETVAQSFVPYVAVPLAVGLLSRRRHPALVPVAGAAASVLLVVVFYGVTAVGSEYGIDLFGPLFWAAVGSVTGAALGVGGRVLAPIAVRWPTLCATALGTGLASAEGYVVVGGRYSTGEQLALVATVALWAAVLATTVRQVASGGPRALVGSATARS